MKYYIYREERWEPEAELVPSDFPNPEWCHELTDEEHAMVQKFHELRRRVENMLEEKIGP